MAHVKLHFAKRASASGTHLFPDLSIVTIKLEAVRAAYAFLRTVGAEVHLRHASSPTSRQAQEIPSSSHPHETFEKLM